MNLKILLDGSFSGIFLRFKSSSNRLDESSNSTYLLIKLLFELVRYSPISSISLSKNRTLFFRSFPRIIPLNISFSVTFLFVVLKVIMNFKILYEIKFQFIIFTWNEVSFILSLIDFLLVKTKLSCFPQNVAYFFL